MNKSIVRIGGRGKRRRRAAGGSGQVEGDLLALDTRVAMIQALLPLGLKAVNDVLQEEVTQLAGARYSRGGGYARWGGQQGSVYLADQKVSVRVPRVRDTVRDQEVPLTTYAGLQNARRADDAALRKVLKGLSCRDYESCVDPVAQTFGLSASSLSRRFRRASGKKLQELSERDLSKYDVVGLFLDGKTFGDDEIVIALGVTISGEKVVLGFVQTATENELVCTQFLRSLIERGLDVSQGLLCVIDGSKGLRKAVDKVLASKVLVQRCHWHKRENVVRYLPAGRQAEFRRKLQNGYQQPTYEKAKATLKKVRAELGTINRSAVSSLDEGFEETLTLHRLGLFEELGPSFKTTNCIENLNSLVGQRTNKIDCWRNSEQKHRWLATTVLEIEPRLRKVRGHRYLPRLRAVLQNALKIRRAEVA
jgi:transposase-like protein